MPNPLWDPELGGEGLWSSDCVGVLRVCLKYSNRITALTKCCFSCFALQTQPVVYDLPCLIAHWFEQSFRK